MSQSFSSSRRQSFRSNPLSMPLRDAADADAEAAFDAADGRLEDRVLDGSDSQASPSTATAPTSDHLHHHKTTQQHPHANGHHAAKANSILENNPARYIYNNKNSNNNIISNNNHNHNNNNSSSNSRVSILETKPARYICSNVIEPKIVLYSMDSAPKFVLQNAFIWTGYRAFLPYRLCLKSLFIWSNETINIWTHLLGWMFFFGLQLYDNLVVFPEYRKRVTKMELIIGNVSLLCFQICMAMSVCFHVFGCHSEKVCQQWLGMDLSGISAATLGCYLPGIYYAFYCFPFWRDLYLGVVLLILLLTLLFPILHSNYLSPKWAPLRISLYLTTMLYGFIPATHWVFLSGGVSSTWVRVFFPKLLVTYSLAGVAFGFYISDFPERLFPGRFDFLGHAHQWWHILIVGVLYYWHEAGLSFMKKRLVTACFVNGDVAAPVAFDPVVDDLLNDSSLPINVFQNV